MQDEREMMLADLLIGNTVTMDRDADPLGNQVRKRNCGAICIVKMTILPRQARDKCRENSKKLRFLIAYECHEETNWRQAE